MTIKLYQLETLVCILLSEGTFENSTNHRPEFWGIIDRTMSGAHIPRFIASGPGNSWTFYPPLAMEINQYVDLIILVYGIILVATFIDTKMNSFPIHFIGT
ncbi:hypothetical protein LOAG_05688, partial [Loa loa]